MDKKALTNINFSLSAQNIRPFDILLALGEKDLVPDDIEKNRLQRVLQRDGKESPQGYLRNAIEDLTKMSFTNKPQILSTLKSQLGGLGQDSPPPPLSPAILKEQATTMGMLGILILLAIPIYLIFTKKEQEVLIVAGPISKSKKRR